MENESFVKWLINKFTARTHFVRFIASVILIPTVIMVLNGRTVPNEMWITVGTVVGFYYKSHKDD